MVRIRGKAVWFFMPALTDILIGGKPFECFESLREVIGHQKGMQMLFQMVMSLVVIFFHSGVFKRAVHAFHLTIGPGMVSFGEAMLDAILLADAIENMMEGVLIALAVGELNTIIS